MTKSKMGRPRREKQVAEARMVATCTKAELALVRAAAARAGLTTSEYIRRAVFTALRVAELDR